MNERAKRISEAIEKSGYSYPELSKITGISKSSLQRYATGETKKIPIDCIEKIANATNTDSRYLMGWKEETTNQNTFFSQFNNISPIQTQRLPLLGEIACGEPIFCDEDRESYVEVGTNIRADFCLRAKGDSMINARICDGDIVFIKQQPMVENGDIAAVVIDNEATLKRVYYDKENGKLVLQAENPKYGPIVCVGEELNTVHILGKAIAFESNL